MNNLVIPSSIPKPPFSTSTKQDNPTSESSQKPTKTKPTSISFTKNPLTDSYLNYLCKNGHLNDAVVALDSIAQNGSIKSKLKPKTFINLLQSCIDSNSIALGRRIHERVDLVEERTPPLETKLVGMYAECGALEDARKVFVEMRERDLDSWSAMIRAFSREQRWKEVVEMFYMMMEDNVLPDGFLLPKILQACGNKRDIWTGKSIHSLVVKCGIGSYPLIDNTILAVYAKCGELGLARKFFENMDMRDRVAWNAMISGYCQIGEIEQARRLFDEMCEEGVEPSLVTWNILIAGYNKMGYCDVAMELMRRMEGFGVHPDVVIWTSMISGLAQNKKRSQALDLFKEMILAGVEPNGITIASAISACASLEALCKGLEVHCLGVKLGFVDDVLVGNALIDMYSKCRDLDAARQVFDAMMEKDIYTWNSMIGGYCQAGYCGKAYVLFMEMQKSNVPPNVITWNTMISGHIENRNVDKAMEMFQRMEKDGKVTRDTATWNSLIAGYLHIGQKSKALSTFRQMQSSGFRPNTVTILSVLRACASLVAFRKVKEIHSCVLRRNLDVALSITNSLIDTYGKSGNMLYAQTVFDRVPSKDFITFNSLITGYVLHGCSHAALDLGNQMTRLGLQPTGGTFSSIILAHGLSGMVDEGKRIFSSMSEDYQRMPALEHYSAMVDLYGRSGRLEDAIELIEGMPIKPDSSVWSALLTAARVRGEIGLAIRAGESLLELEPGNFLVQQSISQAYAMCGKPANAVKRLEKDKTVPSLIGQSWIEVKNTMHSFISGDQSKSCSDLLFSWVQSISTEVKAHYPLCGFCIEEEEKEEIVGLHSEKLAIAFAFFCSKSAPQSVRIVKNLRMCGDCHRMAKYVSTKYKCEIYLSDSKCFHLFKSGYCSCGDYW